LCVDDNPDVANTLVVLLNLSGFEARGCLDGFSALEVAGEFRPDACLIDACMPGMDGYELAKRLRALLGPEVRLIALSAYQSEEHEARVSAAGFDQSFTKPPDIVRLLEAIAAADPAAQRKTAS
jgi:DNA-binding response OmpR family regulator